MVAPSRPPSSSFPARYSTNSWEAVIITTNTTQKSTKYRNSVVLLDRTPSGCVEFFIDPFLRASPSLVSPWPQGLELPCIPPSVREGLDPDRGSNHTRLRRSDLNILD